MTQRFDLSLLGRHYTLTLSATLTGYWIVFLRLLVGWWFFHEGLNKYATPGAFTAGWFLGKTGTIVSPLLNMFAGGMAETAINLIIPIAEVLIGIGVILGCLTRLASFFGTVMMGFFYFGNEAWRRGFVNGELMGLVLFVTIIIFGAGRVWGIDAQLEETDFVQSHQWIRYLLG